MSGGEIAAGAMSVDLICDCLSAGTIGNDYQAGQLNILVDPIPYIAAVSNIDVSSGGIDEESEAMLDAFFRKTNSKIIIIQHYGGGSGLLKSEILLALSNFK